MKASITFYPNATKKSKKTGKVPLYARVYCNALKAEERLNAEVTENDLAKWDAMSMRFSDRSIMANKLINVLDKRFEEFHHFACNGTLILYAEKDPGLLPGQRRKKVANIPT